MYENKELLKKFIDEHFCVKSLKDIGVINKNINNKDYVSIANEICRFFGYKTIYQYKFENTKCHISYANVKERKESSFTTEVKAWHESD